MSYNIFIGELNEKYDPNDKNMDLHAVKRMTLDNAPEFGFDDLSGKSNGRFPGYSQMSDFCEISGLYELFFNKNHGLLCSHPGYKPITHEHLNIIIKAKKEWEKNHLHCKELLPTKDKEPDYTQNNLERSGHQYDWIYARLVWFEFWFKWALENCSKPYISNS